MGLGIGQDRDEAVVIGRRIRRMAWPGLGEEKVEPASLLPGFSIV
jgi:hypothetical protein